MIDNIECKNLWISVLNQAHVDMCKLHAVLRTNPTIMEDQLFSRDFHSLNKWFKSKSWDVGSYQWICLLVDINPDFGLKNLEKIWATQDPSQFKYMLPQQKETWEKIRAFFKEKNKTFREFALQNGFAEKAMSNITRFQNTELQALIAAFMGQEPWDLWPERYTPDGSPIKGVKESVLRLRDGYGKS